MFLGTHRVLMAGLACGFLAFTAWACLAELDIVVSAQGKLVPAAFVRVAQPSEGGVVRLVKVKDGDQVKTGDVLLELDPVFASEDAESSEASAERLQLQLARIDAELHGTEFRPAGGSSSLSAAVLAEYQLRRQSLAANTAEAAAAERKASSDLQTARERLTRARDLLPLVAKQSRMQEELLAQGFVSDAAATDKRRELVDARQELATQESAVASAEAALAQAMSARERVEADYRRQLAAERSQALAEATATEADARKKAHRLAQHILRAPVSGTVNGVEALASGQVVTAGATLLSVVPTDSPLQFEGWIRNEDAAYVVPGMPAKVKLAAYPFQKYGWVEAEVSWVGVDSETPQAMKNAQGEPLFYRARFALKAQALQRDGHAFEFKPGMQAVGDIQLGTRTLFEYLTSPARKVLLEAAREK